MHMRIWKCCKTKVE